MGKLIYGLFNIYNCNYRSVPTWITGLYTVHLFLFSHLLVFVKDTAFQKFALWLSYG